MKNDNLKKLSLSRRSFLIGSVNATLVMAFSPQVFSLNDTAASDHLQAKQFSPTVWFEINPQGKITVNIAKAEMGQHVGTALARIVSDELGANWDDVSIEHVDTDPKWGYMVTGGSWSVFTSFQPLSQAGAAGRIALIDSGSKLLGVSPDKCDVKNSHVVSGKKKISFADIVQKGEINRTFSPEELEKMPVKQAKKSNTNRQCI
jgi:CO/xanthine dehydrogenase Mo-binding subunit